MLKEKVALITGGNKGIGLAIAKKYAQNGANIAIIYGGNDDAAKKAVDEIKAIGVKVKSYKCDVSDYTLVETTIKTVIEDFGSVDILVNNAGITKDNLILRMSEDDFSRVIDINLKGTFNTIKHLYHHFMKKRSGKIINIASVVGLSGNAGQANYVASKSGVIGLTKTVAKELSARGVNCNAIAPGYIETDMTDAVSEKTKEIVKQNIALKKFGKTDDVANLALFLASNMSDYITGETIKVDGGLYI